MEREIEGNPPAPAGATQGGGGEGGSPRISEMLGRLAGGRGAGNPPGGESVEMVKQGAQLLMQAAQMDPRLAPILQQAIQIIQQGVSQLAGGPPSMRGRSFGGPPGEGEEMMEEDEM